MRRRPDRREDLAVERLARPLARRDPRGRAILARHRPVAGEGELAPGTALRSLEDHPADGLGEGRMAHPVEDDLDHRALAGVAPAGLGHGAEREALDRAGAILGAAREVEWPRRIGPGRRERIGGIERLRIGRDRAQLERIEVLGGRGQRRGDNGKPVRQRRRTTAADRRGPLRAKPMPDVPRRQHQRRREQQRGQHRPGDSQKDAPRSNRAMGENRHEIHRQRQSGSEAYVKRACLNDLVSARDAPSTLD